jgi:hypothetical protein
MPRVSNHEAVIHLHRGLILRDAILRIAPQDEVSSAGLPAKPGPLAGTTSNKQAAFHLSSHSR